MRRRDDSMMHVSFDVVPKMGLKDWTNSWQWSTLSKQIVRYKKEGRNCFCMPGGLDKVLSLRDCTKYFNVVDELNWDTLDKYEAHIRTVYYVEYNKKEWILSKCSCIFWAKNYFCHHVVGLAVENKKVQYLDVHKQIEIQNKICMNLINMRI